MTWLIILVLVVAVAVAFLSTARRGAVHRSQDLTEGMDADSRSLYSPIRRLVEDIETIASRDDSMAIRIIGKEAIGEAQRIREQCARALVARTELKKAARGRSVAESEIEDLTRKEAEATTDIERHAFASAREARNLELRQYEEVATTLTHIDANIRQAQAALSEMKTRLSVSAGNEKAITADDEELRATVARMKSLSVSYEEAEQALKS